MSGARRRLIVNADDLGLAASVNRGIIDAVERGIVTSASLMVNMPACDDAIARLRTLCSREAAVLPSVGLHFNIVAGAPLTACRTLLRRGGREFASLPTLAWRSWSRRIDPHDVERELDAQLRRAETLLAPLGLRVTHLDSHRHAHCFPPIYDVVTAVARRHGITHVRHSCEALGTHLRRTRALFAAFVLRRLFAGAQPVDDVHFTGVALMGSRTLERDLHALLAALPDGTTELMVHPGWDSPELATLDAYRAPRERETRALMAPSLRDRLALLQIELTRFADPRAGRASATAPTEPAARRAAPG